MRATDGRPYELKSVPTKTVAVRSMDNCSDLVQNFASHPCLPLEGKVSAQPTDEVKLYPFCAHLTYSLFIIHSLLPPHQQQDEHQQQEHRDRADYDDGELLLMTELLRSGRLRLGLVKLHVI